MSQRSLSAFCSAGCSKPFLYFDNRLFPKFRSLHRTLILSHVEDLKKSSMELEVV